MASPSTSSSNSSPSLPSLLPSSSYLVAYALPLLLVSLVLTFAGAFLTLDRTRRFRGRNDVTYAVPGDFGFKGIKKRKRYLVRMMVLEGGVGGVLLGYAFGVHLSTFLSLVIPATSSTMPSLSSGAFVAIWVLSTLCTMVLGGRYAFAALTFAGISGGALFALAVSVIVHPGLKTRVVFTIVGMCILLIAVILSSFVAPLAKFKHPLVRFAASSTGAFGVTMSISLLSSSSPSWSSIWSHLYLNASDSWDTSSEKGFSALFCVLGLLGALCDWVLWGKWGECPDEKWDEYLAEYAANFPNNANRAGTFRPFTSVWDRMFGAQRRSGVIEQLEGAGIDDAELGEDVKYPFSPGLPGKLRKNDPSYRLSASFEEPLPLYKPSPGLLKKSSSRRSGRPRHGFRKKEIVKFKPLDELSSGDEDEDEDKELDYEKELGRIRGIINQRTESYCSRSQSPGISDNEGNNPSGPPEYSDFEESDEDKENGLEEDIVGGERGGKAVLPVSRSSPRIEEWTPRFLKRHPSRSSQAHSSSTHSSPSKLFDSQSSERTMITVSSPVHIHKLSTSPAPSDQRRVHSKSTRSSQQITVASSSPALESQPSTSPAAFDPRHLHNDTGVLPGLSGLAAQIPSSPLSPVSAQPTPPQSMVPEAVAVAVPATPSLINALDRVEKARREAYAGRSRAELGRSGNSGNDQRYSRDRGVNEDSRDSRDSRDQGDMRDNMNIRADGRGQRWNDFWKEVQEARRRDHGEGDR